MYFCTKFYLNYKIFLYLHLYRIYHSRFSLWNACISSNRKPRVAKSDWTLYTCLSHSKPRSKSHHSQPFILASHIMHGAVYRTRYVHDIYCVYVDRYNIIFLWWEQPYRRRVLLMAKAKYRDIAESIPHATHAIVHWVPSTEESISREPGSSRGTHVCG